jgi:uncharacterized membrane protein YdjX (TVP38/TMEM64 family)
MESAWAEWLTQTMEWIRGAGWVGFVWFIVLYVVSGAVFLPGSILTVGAGAVYGWGTGTLLVATSSSIGALLNFMMSRYLARGWIERRLESRPRFRSLAHAIGTRGWPLIMLSRLSPIFPHSIVSYAAGLTRIGALKFFASSFAGFLPLSAAYAYAGAVLGKVAMVRTGVKQSDPLAMAVWIGGLGFTILVTVLGARLVAHAFREGASANNDSNSNSVKGMILLALGWVCIAQGASAQEVRRAQPVEREVPVARARAVVPEATPSMPPSSATPAVPDAVTLEQAVPHVSQPASIPANEVALFLAGLRVPPGSRLEPLQASAAYGEHSYAMGQLWRRFNENHFIPMRLWSEITLAGRIDPKLPLTYFFGGPDAINAIALYPEAPCYLLLGLEPPGEIPTPLALSAGELESSLSALRRAVEVVLSYGHFITRDMREDLSRGAFRGQLPLAMVFVALSGGDVVAVSHIGVGRGGVSRDLGPSSANSSGQLPGVTVQFQRSPTDSPQVITFLQANISDGYLKSRSDALDWVARFGTANAYLKAASYLLHEANFSRVRNFILQKSASILQDDSGIPLRELHKAGWQVELFGTYSGTLDIFSRYFQSDLQEAYAASIPPGLPFGTGYKWRKGESNLMLATPRREAAGVGGTQ